MVSTSTFAETASLVGDPARANMLVALMDGRALTAAELARAAGISPQTTSGHLARLTEVGLLAMERQGRHRYHRLASPAIARMLEGIMAVSAELAGARAASPPKPIVVGPRDAAMRRVRVCFDHLAGEIAVTMTDRMMARGHLDLSPDGGVLTEAGTDFLHDLGVDLDTEAGRGARRSAAPVFCRPCFDWSERRPHIAGALGAAICRCCVAKGWIRRMEGTRAVTVTRAGELALGRAFDLRAGVQLGDSGAHS